MNIFLTGGEDDWKERVRDGVDWRVNCYFPTNYGLIPDLIFKSNRFKVNNSDVVFIKVSESTWLSEEAIRWFKEVDTNHSKLIVIISDSRTKWSEIFWNALVIKEVDDVFDVIKNLLPNKVIEAY